MSCVFQNIDPPTPLSAGRVCSVYPPPLLRGEDPLAGYRGGWGSIFWKTQDTALYSTFIESHPWLWKSTWLPRAQLFLLSDQVVTTPPPSRCRTASSLLVPASQRPLLPPPSTPSPRLLPRPPPSPPSTLTLLEADSTRPPRPQPPPLFTPISCLTYHPSLFVTKSLPSSYR
jgi:hypothetical protein